MNVDGAIRTVYSELEMERAEREAEALSIASVLRGDDQELREAMVARLKPEDIAMAFRLLD
ncbi:MAG: hypothetical protein LH654_09020 [Thermoleophilia bacterium]|nr:hypothetical protein [Thermoleophilia bacterium]